MAWLPVGGAAFPAKAALQQLPRFAEFPAGRADPDPL